MAAAMPAAWAATADPTHGASVYTKCAACHGSAANPTIPQVTFGRNAPSVILNAIAANTGGMGTALAGVSAADIADVAAFLGNLPATLAFPVTTVGQVSAAQSITMRASNLLPLSSITTAVTGDFRISGGTCGTDLPAGASCTVDVQFAPGVAAAEIGTLTITHSGIPAGVQFPLRGTGTAPVTAPAIALGATGIAFGDQVVSTASAAQSVSVGNTGTAALHFSSIAVSGAASGDFAAGGTCRVDTPLAAGSQCTVSATFTPTAVGARTAALAIASDGGSAQLALAGNGIAQPTPNAAFSVAQLSFGNQNVGTTSAPQSVTLNNGGTGTLDITSIQASAPFAIAQNGCGSSLAPHASCQVQVTFKPVAAIASSGQLSLSSNSPSEPALVVLMGAGVVAAPQLAWTPVVNALDFGSSTVGSAAALKTITLANQGPGTVTITDFRIAGTNAGDFHVDASSTCSTSAVLAAGSTCNVVIGYVPHGVGAESASFEIVSNGTSPGQVALAGLGVAPPMPVLSLSAATLDFALPAAGTKTTHTLTITNTGLAALVFEGFGVTSPAFTIAGTADHGCATSAPLEPGASCGIDISWSGGESQASLNIGTNASQGAQSVALIGEQPSAPPSTTANSNYGGGGCTMGNGTGLRDPSLIVMAIAAALLAWRRRRNAGASANAGSEA